MVTYQKLYEKIDRNVISFLRRWSIPVLRVCLGINFFWFGVLKFFPGLSPAEELAGKTSEVLSFGLIGPALSIPIIAFWEMLIGLGLITGKYMRFTLLLMFLQMLGAMSPILIFPGETFTQFPYAPTLEGQYIIKNLVLLAAGLVVGATVTGARLRESRQSTGAKAGLETVQTHTDISPHA